MESAMPLSRLPMGQRARILSLDAPAQARRRILDLGMVTGTRIEPLYKSPSGDPVAYLVRGAVIALREDISGRIMVSPD